MLLIIISTVWLASEIILAGMKRSRPHVNDTDRGSQKILWMVIVISVLLGIFAGLQTYGRSAFHIYFYWTGIVLIVSGLTIRWIAIFRLKKQFTVDVAIGKESKIVKEGIYKYIRHPSYTGSLLSFLGLGTAFANYFSMAVIFIPILLAFLYRIKIEETALMEAFGEEYRQYSARAKKLIPGIY